MKKITTLIIGLLITIVSFSQKTYSAYRSEIYKLENTNWKLSSYNEDIDIPIYIYKRFIHIQAKQNAYLLVNDESVDISGNTFKGNSYDAYEFVTETNCTIHAVDFKNGESMLSITWFDDKVNIRYYVKKIK